MARWQAGLLLLATLAGSGTVQARDLRQDEQVLFLPQPALRSAGWIELWIETFVYELERRPGAHTAFGWYLGVDRAALSPAQAELFLARTQLFRIDAERGKRVRVQFTGQPPLLLDRTDAHGRSSTALRLPDTVASDPAWLDFQVQLPPGDARRFAGRVQLLDPQGWSVVSDIDDTIKHSQVLDREQLLLNTFVRPFEAVPELAAVYRQLADQGVRFHYVSSSPVQLYPPLEQFIRSAGFPEGSVHLRTLKLRKEILASSEQSRQHKTEQIRTLLQRFEQRRFILIGDSGEADPEIYAELLIAHPRQIRAIHIRDVTAQPRSAARYQNLLPAQLAARLHVFQNAEQLLSSLPSVD